MTRSVPDDATGEPATGLIRFVRAELERLADPKLAPGMAAYMKTTQPFYGVMSTPRREVMQRAWRQHAPADAAQWKAGVGSLFELGKGCASPGENPVAPRKDSSMRPPVWGGQREWFYMACEYAERGARSHAAGALPLLRSMIVQSGWWDIVDWVAGKVVGAALNADAGKTSAVMERWIVDKDLWLRRSAIICQLGRKQETDVAMLSDFCLRTAHERDFFIRKAIGWALRQHARTDPHWVRSFVASNRGRLSSLSVREALLRL